MNDELTNNIGIERTDYTLSEQETAPFVVTYLNSGRSYLIDENGNISEYSEYVDISKYVEIGQLVAYNPTVSDKNGTPVDSNKLTYTSPTGSAKEYGNGYTSTEKGEEGEKDGGQKFTATANTK